MYNENNHIERLTHAFNHPYDPRTEYFESEGGGREGRAGKGRGGVGILTNSILFCSFFYSIYFFPAPSLFQSSFYFIPVY